MAIDIHGRPALFCSEIEEEWMGRGQARGRKEEGYTSQDVKTKQKLDKYKIERKEKGRQIGRQTERKKGKQKLQTIPG